MEVFSLCTLSINSSLQWTVENLDAQVYNLMVNVTLIGLIVKCVVNALGDGLDPCKPHVSHFMRMESM